jgi:hypothetical protein
MIGASGGTSACIALPNNNTRGASPSNNCLAIVSAGCASSRASRSASPVPSLSNSRIISGANLPLGALNGGTAQPPQMLIFRSAPGMGRAETPVERLYLGSASATPGGSVHGACGRNAAKAG